MVAIRALLQQQRAENFSGDERGSNNRDDNLRCTAVELCGLKEWREGEILRREMWCKGSTHKAAAIAQCGEQK